MNVILIQARMSSTRFPEKMLKEVGSYTLLEYVYQRCATSSEAKKVAIATSSDKSDDKLYQFCINKKIPVYRGDLHNVLERYVSCGLAIGASKICRVCGDSPFVDIEAIDKGFNQFHNNNELEYISTSNTLNGFMSEIFTLDILKKITKCNLTKADKEHVTQYIRNNIATYNTKLLELTLKPDDLSDYTLTVDYPADLDIVKNINKYIKDFYFKSDDIIKILYKIKDCM